MGGGYEDILNKLCERRDNVKRDVNLVAKSAKKRSGPEEIVRPKKKPRESYGCVSWQPLLPDVCSTLSEKIAEMKHKFLDGVPFDDDIRANMKQSYALQRQLINGGTKFNDVKNEFLYLFSYISLLDHFNELIGMNANDVLSEAMRSKGLRVYKYLKEKVREFAGESDTYVRQLPWLVASYFKEDKTALLKVVEVRCCN